MTAAPIETRYAGCRFRSRLEARWAVFFDALGIKWQYEPQGYRVNGRPYLPDFLLTECGTWIEVKGSEREVDRNLLEAAGRLLPRMPYQCEPGPRLMLLGPIPEPIYEDDWGWRSFGMDDEDDGYAGDGYPRGFAIFQKCKRPWAFWESIPSGGLDDWLAPERSVGDMTNAIPHAYRLARSARFEHGEAP